MNVITQKLSKTSCKLLKSHRNGCTSRKTSLRVSSGETKRKIQPVKLSYASYQNTQSYTSDIPAPLIVMHGLFGSKGNWNSLCKAMLQHTKPQRRILAVDARNHGESPHNSENSYDHLSADVKEFMGDQEISKAALLGHSMGGRTMMMFALKYPQFVDRLIVADISPISSSTSMNSLYYICKALKAVKFNENSSLSAARIEADRQLQKVVSSKEVRMFLMTNLVQNSDGKVVWRLNIDALTQNYSNIMTFPKMDNLRYDGPTLFVAGAMSDYIQKSDYSKIREIFPKAEFHSIEGAGHWLHSEKPTDFLKVVCDFLNKSNVVL